MRHQLSWCAFVAGSVACPLATLAQTSSTWLTPPWALGSKCSAVRLGGVQGGYIVNRDQSGNLRSLPTIWSGTEASAINLLPSGRGSSAGTVNGLSGHRQVGWVNDVQFGSVAAYWEGTADSFRALTIPSSDYVGGSANAIAGDQVVGEASYLQGRGGEHACLWDLSTGAWRDLHPANSVFSTAHDTDGESQVGYVYLPGRSSQSAVMWRGTASSAVVLEPPGSRESECFAVANGTQVGHVQTTDLVMRPVVWHGTASSWRDLLPTGCIRGQILDTTGDIHVGWVTKNGVGDTAVLWFGDNRNTILELRTLLGPQWGPCVATSISVEGDIATIGGYGRIAGSVVEQGILWTVRVPTPAGAVVLVMGGLVASRRRERSEVN